MSSNTNASRAARAIFWNFASLGVSTVTGIITARMLMPDLKGVLSLSLTLISLSALVNGWGTSVAFRALFPRGLVGLEDYRGLTAKLLAPAAVVAVGVAMWCLRGNVPGSYPLAFVCVLALTLLSYGASQGYDALNAAGLNVTSARINAFGNAFVCAFLVPAALLGTGLQGALLAYLLGYLARQLFLARVSRTHLSGQHPKRVLNSERLLLREGFKYLGLNLGQAVTFRMDLIVLEVLAGATATGLYAVAATPAAALQIFSSSIGQVIFRGVADGTINRAKLTKFAGAAMLLTLTCGAALALSADLIVGALFGQNYGAAADLMRWLVLAEVFASPYMILSRAAAGLIMPGVASGSGLAGVGLMLGSLVILVPRLGATGAAIACLTTYLTLAIGTGIPVFRRLGRSEERPGKQ